MYYSRILTQLGTAITTALTLVSLTLFCPARSHAQQEADRQLVQANAKPAVAARRVALVIGNGAYTNAPPLKNPPNDARDMAANLKTLGFDVSTGVNLSQREMKRLIREFGQKLKAGGNGLFYYAGHGVQARGRNYIIPVDADIQSEADVEDSGVDVGLVLNYMDDAQNGLNIVILDACRNNPFSRSFRSASEGLAQVDAPSGTLIAYATAPGRVAADGVGVNGLYTSELLQAMRQPGLTATDMFMRVRAEVMRKTGNKQVPWEASSLVGSFYFTGSPTGSSSVNSGANNTAPTETRFDAAAFEYNYWDSIKNSANAGDFQAYLTKYPNGQFAELAKNRIKTLEVSAKPANSTGTSNTSDTTAEVAFWDHVKNSSNVEDFQAYLKKYPNGAFSELASIRARALESAAKEREKADEARRAAEALTRPLRTFDVEYGEKNIVTEYYMSARLIIFAGKFRMEADERALRNMFSTVPAADADRYVNNAKNWLESWDCSAFKHARLDKLLIREIQPKIAFGGKTKRMRFKSESEAAEALSEVQRVCKANP